MKLAPEALAQIIEILRLGLTEGCDVSQLLRDLDLSQNEKGLLIPSRLLPSLVSNETD